MFVMLFGYVRLSAHARPNESPNGISNAKGANYVHSPHPNLVSMHTHSEAVAA
jgi:hypothetical protein